VQTILVAKGRTAVHRRLGIAGVLLAAAFVATGPLVAIGEARRGFDLSSDLVPRGTSQSAGTLLSVLPIFVLFGLLVAGAVWYRHRPEVHKRLMLLAILGPLMGAPVAHLVGHWDALRPWAGPIFPIANAALLAVLPIHDRLTRGRVHPVSRWGAILVFLWFIVTFVVVAPTPTPPLLPVAGPHERAPIERMPSKALRPSRPQDRQGRTPYGGGRIQLLQQPASVERGHPLPGRVVLYRPQAHDHGPGTRHLEGSSQPEETFADPELTEAGVATGQNGPLDTIEVQCGDLFGGEHAVLLVGCCEAPTIGARQG